jgi:hypothetical protein
VSWCDRLASTPSVGFKFDSHFAPSAEILEVLKPVLDPLVERDRPKFTINRLDPFSLDLSTDDGFHYGIDHCRAWIDFQHRIRVKPVSGGPPVAELLSSAAPFSELLPQVSNRLLDAARLLLEIHPRKLIRVGIVTSTNVAEDDLPPGISRLLTYMGRPWKGLLEQYSFQITATLEKNENWVDQCSHVLVKPEDPEQLPTIRFDWGRTFLKERSATPESLKKELDQVVKDSMKYFEELGEGNRFDEELIRGTK